MAKLFDTQKQFDSIVKSALETVKKSFPIEGNRHKLVLREVWVDDKLEVNDLPSQKNAKINGKSWAVPVLAAVDLIDVKTGKVIDSTKRMRLLDLPKITPRASYIVEGNEYQVVNQLRLKPGVYTRIKQNGELESKVNLAKGWNFDILLNQERGVFTMKVGTANIKLYPVLLDLGISKQTLIQAWGPELVATNEKITAGIAETEIKKLRNALMKKADVGRGQAINDVKEYLSDTRIDPKTTEITMGKAFTVADSNLILETTKRLLQTARGEKDPDDRDSMVFKSLHSVEDFIGERLTLNQETIKKSIINRLDRKFKVSEILNKKVFDDPVKTLFTQTRLAATPEQINPLHMYSGQLKLTIMGEGGIQSEQAVSTGARQVHPTELGFVDPVHTPQSSMVGAVTRLPVGAKKRGNEIKTVVEDAKTGKVIEIGPAEFENSIVAFTDQYKKDSKGKWVPISSKIKAMLPGNKPGTVSPSKVDYIMVDPMQMFSISTNLIPFLNSTQGNRALMAAGQYEQALSLKHREQPLVQVDTGWGTTAESDVGKALSHTSPVSGEVTKITNEYIHIKDSKGKTHKVGIYDEFPLNQKTFLSAEPIVSVGDKVKKDQVIADNNYTKDGVLSMGTNLRVAYMPYKGYNFEDGIVISETAAKKLTSEHMHKVNIRISEGGVIDKKKFIAYFPTLIKAENAAKLDEDGVIREGETVEMGDVLIAYMTKSLQTPERMAIQKLHRSLMRPYRDSHEAWKYEFRGIVSKVVKTPKEVTVYIRTEEPATIGDKLSGRYGNKGIIASILPDNEMPHTEDGDPTEVLLNPVGIPSRLNPSQILETAAAKVADKTGETFKIRSFANEDNYEVVAKALKDAGINDKEILIDPEDGKPLGAPVMVGKQFITKLDQSVSKKFSARSRGAYTVDMQPASGSGESGQSMDQYTMYAMLSHGAKDNLREIATYKAERNDEFWRALQLGHPLPKPKPTFAYEKFVEMMRAAGVNVEKQGNKIQLLPMRDKDTEELSNGKVDNVLIIKAKNLEPEKGGIFDPKITGGMDGSHWAHIELSEPMPNPVFENAIKTILGIKQSTYDDIIAGRAHVDHNGVINNEKKGETGGAALKTLLKGVNIKERLKQLRAEASSAKANKLDKLNKEIRYLRALDDNGISPDEYIVSKVPVIPPKFRPIYPMPDGSLQTSDVNWLYKDVGLTSEKLHELRSLPDGEKENLRTDLYKSMKALAGLGNPVTYKDYRGFIEQIKGRTQPKTGFFQKKLVRKRQDLTGRSTIVPEPELNVDEVGLPKKMIWKVYEPHIVRELVQRGYTPLEAQKQVKEQTPVAQKVLEIAAEKRPILLNRAPSLHKFSIMGFKPKVTSGKTIKIHPLVVKGFNADFDGDNMNVHVPVTEKARVEAFNLLPTNNIFDQSTGDVMIAPQNEMIFGLYSLTKEGSKVDKYYKNLVAAKEAVANGEIKTNSVVKIGGRETTPGRAMVNEILPEKFRDDAIFLNKKSLKDLLERVARDDKGSFGAVVDALKNLGNQHAFKTGFTVGMEDIAPTKKARDKAELAARKALGKSKSDSKIIDVYSQTGELLSKLMQEEMAENDSALYHMANSGAKGSWDQLRQITAAPVLVQDHSGSVIPEPIMKSYSEGLDMAGYWSSMYGARAGTIGRSLQTSVPGYFQKRLVGSVMGSTVTSPDCGTNQGIEMDVNSRDILGRYLASGNSSKVGKKNDEVDSNVIAKAKAAKLDKLLVRSPLTCEAPEGLCVMCFGRTADGATLNVGDNAGTMTAQALSEPLVQMSMNAFHTGGVAGAGGGTAAIAKGYERVAQLLEMPEIVKGKATLASVDGRVDNIEPNPAGGNFVWVEDQRHFVPQGRRVTVSKGDHVVRGDYLSDGVAKPQELLEYKGMDATREYIASELQKAYDKPIKRNFFEAITKEITNLTHIANPGSSNDFDFGDYAPLNKIDDINRKGGDIAHHPILKGINTLPLMSEDWMARMATQDIAKTIREGASRGWSSDIHGTHPIPAYVYGAEFGQGTEGRY